MLTKEQWKFDMPYAIFIRSDFSEPGLHGVYACRNYIRCKIGTTKLTWQPIMVYDEEIYLYTHATRPWKSKYYANMYYRNIDRVKFKLCMYKPVDG